MFRKNCKRMTQIGIIILMISTILSDSFAYDKTYTTYMGGNSHIDTAWLWTTNTTRKDIVPKTFTQAMDLMNANPDYTFNASAALHYKWIKNDNPALFNQIKTKVAEGKWAIVGGQYIEPDLNISSGESLVRQSLFGQRFFQQEFGRKCNVGYVPDVFGFNGQMPQILKKSGMDYFVTTKLNWNDTNTFPYEIFKWNGIDGSQLIVDKPRSDYSVDVDRDNIQSTLDEPDRHGIKKGLVLYGSGDSGGGPTQSQIDSIRAMDNDASMPNVKMNTVNSFFNDLTPGDKQNITDTYNGEMYFENHRGTYTSQALIKKNNRTGEIAAEEAEKFSSIANYLGTANYNQSGINKAWELILLNQFHDILPGSGTNNQVREAHKNGQLALDSMKNIMNNAISSISSNADTTVAAGVPVVVYNPLSFTRKQPVETSVTFDSSPSTVKVFDSVTGGEVPSQILSISGNTATIVFIADQVPSVGYKVFNAVPNTGNYNGYTGLYIGNNQMSSDMFDITINSATGNISRIFDKVNYREVVSGGEGNELQILEDTPNAWDAWNVDYDDMTAAPLTRLNTAAGISIVENGPVKCTYRIDKSYGSSTFSQYITLYPGINRVDIRMTANWQESHKMLKVAFPLSIYGTTSASYEIPYGAVDRSNQRDTLFNQARFEVPAQKWADLSGWGYGISLLNNCKYGYDTYQNTMRLSLLRSPKDPDPLCDMGQHEFTYSIYPHSGDWKSAGTVNKGYELNYPILASQTTSHAGTLGKSASFFSVSAPNVILSVVKKSEDSNDYVLRMYESQGSDGTTATITVPDNIRSLYETNLLEENSASLGYSGRSFTTNFGKYEIKTFKVNFGGAVPAVPNTPSGLSAVGVYPNQINVSWNNVQGATGYDLQVDGVTVTDVTSPYVHTGLSPNSTHTYSVRAANTSGASSWSSSVSAATLPPSGDTNVALNKTAVANQNVDGETPSMAVDGSVVNNSKWCSTANGDKWLSIDLGQDYDISRWVVKHAGAGGEKSDWNTSDFKLQKSEDGTNWTDVDSVTENTLDVTDRYVNKFYARYVRLYITVPTNDIGDTAARIYELELY